MPLKTSPIRYYSFIMTAAIYLIVLTLFSFNFSLLKNPTKTTVYFLGSILQSGLKTNAGNRPENIKISLIPPQAAQSDNISALGPAKPRAVPLKSSNNKKEIKATFLEKTPQRPQNSTTTLKDLGITDNDDLFKPLRIGQ